VWSSRVKALTGGRGADYAFEVIGLPKTITQAYERRLTRDVEVPKVLRTHAAVRWRSVGGRALVADRLAAGWLARTFHGGRWRNRASDWSIRRDRQPLAVVTERQRHACP
jgi:hypothetical protein